MLIVLNSITWFDCDVIISDFIGCYYDVLREDRNKFGGGIMLLVDKNLHSERLETLHINDVVESKKPSNPKKWTRKDTISQYLRKLIYKKKKM